MRPCESLFGQDRGREIHEFVEAAVGGTCPCLDGRRGCPLLSGDGGAVVELLMPVPAVPAPRRHDVRVYAPV